MAGYVVWAGASLLLRCVTQHEGRPNAETEALRLSNCSNKVTRIVRRDSSFVVVVDFFMNFSASFENERCKFFLAARMVDIVVKIVLTDFLIGKSPQT